MHTLSFVECSRPDPSPLNFDLFLELLSNHTDIARTLRRAPVFSDMDHDIPAYEIRGRGFHLTNDSISTDIRRVCTCVWCHIHAACIIHPRVLVLDIHMCLYHTSTRACIGHPHVLVSDIHVCLYQLCLFLEYMCSMKERKTKQDIV